MPRGYTPPSPELTTSVPALSGERSGTLCSSRKYFDAPSARCPVTMPNALPSAAIALTRKSGCGQKIASENESSARSTMPTSPSAVTTGESDSTPAFFPADSVTVKSSPSPRPCSASAGMNPHFSAEASPSSLRSRSFSSSTPVSRCERSVTLSAILSAASCARNARRESSAFTCIDVSGATSVVLSAAAAVLRAGAGRTRHTRAVRPHAAASTRSTRGFVRAGRRIDSLRPQYRLKCSAPTSTSPHRRECARSRARRRSMDPRRCESAVRSPA